MTHVSLLTVSFQQRLTLVVLIMSVRVKKISETSTPYFGVVLFLSFSGCKIKTRGQRRVGDMWQERGAEIVYRGWAASWDPFRLLSARRIRTEGRICGGCTHRPVYCVCVCVLEPASRKHFCLLDNILPAAHCSPAATNSATVQILQTKQVARVQGQTES